MSASEFFLVRGWPSALNCPACELPLHDPLLLTPCNDLICRGCIFNRCCGACRRPVERCSPPSPVLQQLCSSVRVRCGRCSWVGTKAASVGHSACCEGDTEKGGEAADGLDADTAALMVPSITEEGLHTLSQFQAHFESPELHISSLPDEVSHLDVEKRGSDENEGESEYSRCSSTSTNPLLHFTLLDPTSLADNHLTSPHQLFGAQSRNAFRALLIAYCEMILPHQQLLDNVNVHGDEIVKRALALPGATAEQVKNILLKLRYAQHEKEATILVDVLLASAALRTGAPIRIELIATWLRYNAPRRKPESIKQEYALRQMLSERLDENATDSVAVDKFSTISRDDPAARHFEDDVYDLPASLWSYFGECASFQDLLDRLHST